ncbi:MAG: GNAT family N-acetyltransferase [Steroidobacteraceae bacterium]|nr:GNAT family N-acetyltransferase [Steroidobacteraceae bacterium]MCC7200591.1 GNAT family N-acetyltransferase [Gammaproteobacteria bacterium]
MIVGRTARLELRRFTTAEAQDFFDLNADPEVMRYTGEEPFASLAAARRFLADYDPYSRTGLGRWSLYLLATGEYIGWCGLKYLAHVDEVDVGYRLMRRAWGQGYATEAARFAMDFGFDERRLDVIVARAMHANGASIGVMKKLGMTWEKDFVESGLELCQYRVTRERYLSLRRSPFSHPPG